MSRTVTALYDTRAEAESARERLSAAVDVDSVRIIDQDSSGEEGGQGSSLGGLYMSNEDRHAYSEGIRRGGFLLTAEVDGDEDADEIVRILEQTSSVDLDQKQESWRSEGWVPYSASSGFGSAQTGTSGFGAERGATEEERIPVVQEELNVGKRQVERGGARVRSYVRETPVTEQVDLREEHVSVERQPVDRPLSQSELESGDLLREREVEMNATGEEATVDKEARVTEEVVVRKTAEERSENVSDTVRSTEVDVDGEERSAFGGFGGGSGGSGENSGHTVTGSTDFERTDRNS
ncbi:MAG TPA: YsnF/AvaK domain-containing protein [Allosphingosinicella sp.]|nr:YsnF/AvaK domain-containing protein [Allosphingosinicella sp.]